MILSLSRVSSSSRESELADAAAVVGCYEPLPIWSMLLLAVDDPPLLPYCMLFSRFDFELFVAVVLSMAGGIVDSKCGLEVFGAPRPAPGPSWWMLWGLSPDE